MFQIFIVLLFFIPRLTSGDYWSEREGILNLESSEEAGAGIHLNQDERVVNNILMKYKLDELDDGFRNPENFLPAMHFFKSQKKVAESRVFKFIQQLPKGSSLHVHDTALTSGEYIYNLTFKDGLSACVVKNRLVLKFYPIDNDTFCSWKLVSAMRHDDEHFDDFLKTQLNIIVDRPSEVYPSETDVWQGLENSFATVGPMLYHEPVYREYFYQGLKEFYEDNVIYLEFRSPMHELYDSQGHHQERSYIMNLYLEVIEKFKKDYPDFHGARMIYSPKRRVDNKTLEKYIDTALELKHKYPGFVAGFDLVGQENQKPLKEFVPQLLDLRKKMNFFFHSGETNWKGMSTDINLVDAVLLNTTRIGHGFALLKHEEVLRMVKENSIAIEINPISNQVLKLVEDMRNHPASVLLSRGVDIVICCDDPSFWGAKGLSYDWYMVFMGMASRQADLRLLKQLAINSISYSAMEPDEKEEVMKKWQLQWQKFMNKILTEGF